MNGLKKNVLWAVIIMAGSVMSVQAQRGPGSGYGNNCGNGYYQCEQLPGLTDEQENQINGLRTEHQRKMIDFRNEIQLKHAELNKLQTAANPDMEAINKKIDELSDVKTQAAKQRARHKQEVRSLLNDEQLAIYDSRMGRGNCKGMRGYNRGKGNCQKRCMY